MVRKALLEEDSRLKTQGSGGKGKPEGQRARRPAFWLSGFLAFACILSLASCLLIAGCSTDGASAGWTVEIHGRLRRAIQVVPYIVCIL